MASQHKFHRRKFLRSAGACLALPALEAFAPAAKAAIAEESLLATTAAGMPLRTAFIAVPDGVNVKQWRPQGVGSDYQLGATFEPLENLKDKFQVFTGFEHKNAEPGDDGPGDHARANAVFLTGARPFKTSGADLRNGISVDQIAAQEIGNLTRLKSLELG